MSNAVLYADAGGCVRLTIGWSWPEAVEIATATDGAVVAGPGHTNCSNTDGGSGTADSHPPASAADTVSADTSTGTGAANNAESAAIGPDVDGADEVVAVEEDDESDDDVDEPELVDADTFDEDDSFETAEAFSDEYAREYFGAPAHARRVDVTISVWNSGSYIPAGFEEAVFLPYVTPHRDADAILHPRSQSVVGHQTNTRVHAKQCTYTPPGPLRKNTSFYSPGAVGVA